jgi:thiol-disulfide isomerase/thioredoxin
MKTYKKERLLSVGTEQELERAFRGAGDRLLVVEYVAAWSQPCRAMAPYVTALSQQAEFRGCEPGSARAGPCLSLALPASTLCALTSIPALLWA